MISDLLKVAGAGDVLLAPTVGENIDLEKTFEVLDSADAILVSGGDVEQGMRVLGETKLGPMLSAQHARGKVIIGLSAGSIMLSRQWVRWRDPSDDSTYEAFDCLGLAPILCDTHGEGENWEELQALLQLSPPGAIGYGIPSGAALCVTPEGGLSAMGEAVQRFVFHHGAITRIADLEPGDAGCPGW
jgi:cyanophycinase-like exopeptidase